MEEFGVAAAEAQLHRERARARELRSSAWWKRILARGICAYCRGRFAPAALTMDHRVPLARGGRSLRANLAPCCKACNTAKKQLLPWEWELTLQRREESPPLPGG